MECIIITAEIFRRPSSPQTFWHNRSIVKNPNRNYAQVWWRARMIGLFQASLQLTTSIRPIFGYLSWRHLCHRGGGGRYFLFLINHNAFGRTGVSWFYKSGPTSALSAWPRAPLPTAHAVFFLSSFFARCLICCRMRGHLGVSLLGIISSLLLTNYDQYWLLKRSLQLPRSTFPRCTSGDISVAPPMEQTAGTTVNVVVGRGGVQRSLRNAINQS